MTDAGWLVMQHFQQRIAAVPGCARVHELAVVKEPLTPDNGLPTPALKLRRSQILERYHGVTQQLYAAP